MNWQGLTGRLGVFVALTVCCAAPIGGCSSDPSHACDNGEGHDQGFDAGGQPDSSLTADAIEDDASGLWTTDQSVEPDSGGLTADLLSTWDGWEGDQSSNCGVDGHPCAHPPLRFDEAFQFPAFEAEVEVALSGDGSTLAFGAPEDRSGDGMVIVYRRRLSGWEQVAFIDGPPFSELGHSVALSSDGSLMAVGAPGDRSSSTGPSTEPEDDEAFQAGAVYLFSIEDDEWDQVLYLKAPNTDSGDQFGYVVDLSSDGRTLAVGSPFEDGSEAGINGDINDNGH
ncbi:MAG: hypothetical protein KC561_02365, partial [Myxococcales bacterium]|nr:hypothetical protein [Myxococcales bacterium]